MLLEVIYSKEVGQEVAVFDFKPEIIATKESFVEFCLNALAIKYAFANDVAAHFKNTKCEKPHEVPKIVKLSACVYTFGGELIGEPDWWNAANGKVYFGEEVLDEQKK